MTLYMETTKIEAHKTIGQIQGVLASYGASAILVEYENKEPSAVSFKAMVEGGEIPFRLPCLWREVLELLKSKHKRPRNPQELENQSKRIAWRGVLRWVESQMAFIELRQVKIEQVFFPYIQMKDGKTLFEKMAERGFTALPEK